VAALKPRAAAPSCLATRSTIAARAEAALIFSPLPTSPGSRMLLISVAANAIERCFICAFGGTNLTGSLLNGTGGSTQKREPRLNWC
jgi:hypothetical protein